MDILNYLDFIDIFAVFAYVAVFIVLGIYANRRVKNSRDFTSAGQKLSWVMVAGSTIATTMGGNMVIGKYDLLFEAGVSGITANMFWWVGWLFLLVLAKPLRNSGATSIPQFLEKKYDAGVRKIASYCVLVTVISSCAATFLTIGTVLETLGICSRSTGTWIGALIVILFTVFSGLWGVAITDTIQSVIILITFGIIFPVMVFRTAGGVDAVIASNGPERLHMFTGIAPVTMVGWAITYSLSVGADPSFSQRIFAAKSTKDAVKGQIIAWVFSLAVAGLLSALPALAIQNIFPDMTAGSQFTVRFIALYFPAAAKGLILAVLLGLMLTSGDSYLLVLSSTFVDDMVRPWKPDLPDKKALRISRMSCVCSAVLLCMMALYVDTIYQLFKTGSGAYGAGVFFPLLLGCVWKKANAGAMKAAMLAGCFVSFGFDMFLKIPLGLNMDGCIIGAALCLAISVFGSLWMNQRQGRKGFDSANL